MQRWRHISVTSCGDIDLVLHKLHQICIIDIVLFTTESAWLTVSHVLKVVYFMTIVLSVILILKCGYLIYIQETTICLWRSLIAFHFQCLPLTIFTTVKCNRNYLYRVYHKKEQFKISGINCNKVQPTLYIICTG